MNEQLHIAIIPDGNRRWAKSRVLDPWEGHRKAVENFRSLTQWCHDDPRVNTLTVWCFSTENWKRDKKEIDMLMQLLEEYLEKEQHVFHENKTRLTHSGRTDRIPASLAALLKKVSEDTTSYTENTLNLALDYGGKDEVVRGLRKMTMTPELSEQDVRDHLDHPELSDIDLIIRTSGEQRTSNFFLWQSAYSEWIFCEKLFPDFTSEDLAGYVDAFSKRNRRFGG